MDSNGVPETLVDELDWSDVREPGCYLHVATGMLARIRSEDLTRMEDAEPGQAGQVARLSSNPDTPVGLLRAIAERARYLVKF